MSVRIVHASLNENGKTTGGQIGDQTGREVCVRFWYAKGWTICLRYPDKTLAARAAEIGQMIANSNLVGYCMGITKDSHRNGLFAKLEKYDWNVEKYIASGEKTEADCSSFQYSIWCCLIPELRNWYKKHENCPSTSQMRSAFSAVGFEVLTDSKYLKSSDYCQIGDVLVYEGHHTAMPIDNGAKVQPAADTAKNTTSFTTYKVKLNNVKTKLYIRKEPSKDSEKVGYLLPGHKAFTIREVKNGWGRVYCISDKDNKEVEGWVSLDYVKKV